MVLISGFCLCNPPIGEIEDMVFATEEIHGGLQWFGAAPKARLASHRRAASNAATKVANQRRWTMPCTSAIDFPATSYRALGGGYLHAVIDQQPSTLDGLYYLRHAGLCPGISGLRNRAEIKYPIVLVRKGANAHPQRAIPE